MNATPTKMCTRCIRLRPLAEFGVAPAREDGTTLWCAQCREHKRDWQKGRGKDSHLVSKRKHRQKAESALRSRNGSRRRKYGITPERFLEIVEAQDNKCGLCFGTEPLGIGVWHVDHDHETGAVRGVLCHLCNTQLGAYLKFKGRVSEASLPAWFAKDWRQ